MTIERNLPEAMLSLLSADAVLAALVGNRIFPLALPADVANGAEQIPPSLVYYQADRTDDQNLRGRLRPRVRYEFVAIAGRNADAAAITERIAGTYQPGTPDAVSLLYPGSNFWIGEFRVIESSLVDQRQRWNQDIAACEWRTQIELKLDL